jgi:hypothetical protein
MARVVAPLVVVSVKVTLPAGMPTPVEEMVTVKATDFPVRALYGLVLGAFTVSTLVVGAVPTWTGRIAEMLPS